MRIKILVRNSLKMTDKKMSAQCVHAALGLYKQDPQEHWSCVVLSTSAKKIEEAKASHPTGYTVIDAGYTEVPAGSMTCFAFYEEDPRSQSKQVPYV
jgi:peptidyl-tRNA hydrolase